MNLHRDPVLNVIYNGIKDPIKLCMENNAKRAALQLTFAAIDSMAYLSLPPDKEFTSRADFAAWCDKYLRFNCAEKVMGLEWFAARCGLLHSYTAQSKLSKDRKVRMIGYYGGEGPDIIYRPEISHELVMVRIEGFIEAFFKAVDQFIVDLFSGDRASVAEKRFNTMFHEFAYKDEAFNK